MHHHQTANRNLFRVVIGFFQDGLRLAVSAFTTVNNVSKLFSKTVCTQQVTVISLPHNRNSASQFRTGFSGAGARAPGLPPTDGLPRIRFNFIYR